MINRLLNRAGLHLSYNDDPRLVHVQRRFLETSFDPFTLIAAPLIASGMIRTVVQVGANDGVCDNDPLYSLIHRFDFRAVLVEPQPGPAAKLRELHGGNALVSIAEVAISDQCGELQLWRVDLPEDDEASNSRITSMNPNHLKRFLKSKGSRTGIAPLMVRAVTFPKLLEEFGISRPDLLIIDTEGMDRIVLDQVVIDESGPGVIVFETNNLKSDDLEHCWKRLKAQAYQFILTERDAICIHPEFVSGLRD